MSNNVDINNTLLSDPQNIKERWLRPVNRMGTITILLCILVTFLPSIYLNIRYDAFIGWDSVFPALLLVVVVFGVNWFVEPISFYPVLGNAGSYMGWLAGSVAQQRAPAAIVAREAMEVEQGSQEAEVVSVVAVAGSIVSNLIVLTVTCFVGTAIINVLPEAILSGIAAYVLPAMFGAMLAMFGAKEPLLTIPVFAVMIGLHYLSKFITLPIPTLMSTLLVLVSLAFSILYARALYKKGRINQVK
ncbi:hypothetical protein LJC42_07285 [Eubacteriales bacterium OttesenSCG-928-K08]|nr:hypothetical protein [Eubacteriales bacterium OttesenSCG-928-K08]